MKAILYTSLQIRELFHLEFLRWFTRKLGADQYVLKGGVNLRFFFDSIRYSEDMDIDISRAGVEKLRTVTMDILSSRSFCDGLGSWGVEKIMAPDMQKAKQTGTTQRFKVHLLMSGGQDLFTKIEFSRRGLTGRGVVGMVSTAILRAYQLPPFLVSHYDAAAAVLQKIQALAGRSVVQARDIFDLFLLSSRLERDSREEIRIPRADLAKAKEHIFQVEFLLFRDTVVAYLEAQDQKTYASSMAWDEIRLKVLHFLEEFRNVRD